MVGLLLGAALLQVPGFPSAQQSMFSKVFTTTKPTGNNGYEEYVRAAEITMRPDFQQYNNFLNYRKPVDDADDTPIRPTDVLPNESDLAIRRKFREKFQQCIALVATGNSKPVYDPRDTVHAATLFPEFASFKQLARFETSAARVSFADGQTGEGVERLEEVFVFGVKMSNSILIGRLVGIACDAIALRELDQRWPQLCLNDAEELETFLRKRLATSDLLAPALQHEKAYAHTMVSDLLDKPESLKDLEGGDNPKMAEEMAKLSSAEQQKVASDALAVTDNFYDGVIGLLNGPEKGWMSFKDVELGDAHKPIKQQLTDSIASMMLPSLSGVLTAEAYDRTRFRIALLMTKAIEYRWLTGHLPDKLEDFTAPADRIDPTGGTFRYVPTDTWFQIKREAKDAVNDRLYPPKAPPVTAAPDHP